MSHCSECVSLLSDRRVGEKAQVLSGFSAVSNLYLGIVIFQKKMLFVFGPGAGHLLIGRLVVRPLAAKVCMPEHILGKAAPGSSQC